MNMKYLLKLLALYFIPPTAFTWFKIIIKRERGKKLILLPLFQKRQGRYSGFESKNIPAIDLICN